MEQVNATLVEEWYDRNGGGGGGGSWRSKKSIFLPQEVYAKKRIRGYVTVGRCSDEEQ